MFAERDKHYPSRSGQTSLATAVANITKLVTKNNFKPSRVSDRIPIKSGSKSPRGKRRAVKKVGNKKRSCSVLSNNHISQTFFKFL